MIQKEFYMKNTVLALCLSTLALAACSKPNPETNPDHNQTAQIEQKAETSTTTTNPAPAPQPTGDTAETSLDWQGEYKGVLPCADCEGIETELELNADKSYELTEKYLGKGDGKESKVKGHFQFDAQQSSIITLDAAGNQRKFFVAENQLESRDLTTGAKIEGALAAHYILKKSP